MDYKTVKIVFMGTPEFAVPVLEALHENFDIICAVTKADKPKGRGGKMSACEVKEKALSLGIPVLSPEKIRTPEFYGELSRFEADFFVTCAYGKILPEEILSMPKYGTVNVHASLLPKYRGANPIQRAILDGETVTGVTTMMTDIGMDTGDMLLKEEVQIGDDMTMTELSSRLSGIGAELIVRTLKGLLEGSVRRVKQNEDEATFAPMLEKSDETIDWSKDAACIKNQVRSLDEKPGAYSVIGGQKIKIFNAKALEDDGGAEPGTVIGLSKKSFTVKCGKGALEVFEIQPENSKRMDVRSYLNGHKIEGRFE